MARAYFICPDTDVPSGGVRVIYRHVAHLTAAGIDAAVVHQQVGFQVTWFEDDVPVVYADQITPTADDLLVIPEIYGPNLSAIGPGVPKAIFNQNVYNTFKGYPAIPSGAPTPYAHPEVRAAVVVSEDNRAYLRHGFPGLDVRRTVNCVDPALFYPAVKRRQLAFMPRKHADEAQQVLHLLAARGALDGVDIVALDNMTERQVAVALRETLMFLSFGYPEGCPCPPKEAMAAGCAVVGYHGMGGRDYIRPPHAYPVDQGDIVAYARLVEELLAGDQGDLERVGRDASAFVHETYSEQAERDSAVAVWGDLLLGASAPLARAA
jgi:hypothetical protein